jgi:hypothetical protein
MEEKMMRMVVVMADRIRAGLDDDLRADVAPIEVGRPPSSCEAAVKTGEKIFSKGRRPDRACLLTLPETLTSPSCGRFWSAP